MEAFKTRLNEALTREGIIISEWVLPSESRTPVKPPYVVNCHTETDTLYADGIAVFEVEVHKVHVIYRDEKTDSAFITKVHDIIKSMGGGAYVQEYVSAEQVVVRTYTIG